MKTIIFTIITILALFDGLVALAEEEYTQILIQSDFLSIQTSVLEKLRRQTPDKVLSAKMLLDLKHSGKATSLSAPMTLTRSGQQFTLKSVTEVIYPTALGFDQRTVTNASDEVITSSLVAPEGFQTREVGVTLEVLPDLSPDGSLFNLMIDASIVDPPIWKEYLSEFNPSKGKTTAVPIKLPFFHTQTFTTSAAIKNGATVIVGGGIQNQKGDALTFLLIKAQLVTTSGQAASHIAKAYAEQLPLPKTKFKSHEEWLHFKEGQLAAIAIFEDLTRTDIKDASRQHDDSVSYYPSTNERIYFADKSWIILTSHSIHQTDGLGDMTLGIASDGKYYLNQGHVCGGVILESTKEVESLQDFLKTTGLGPKRESMPWQEHDFNNSNESQQDL